MYLHACHNPCTSWNINTFNPPTTPPTPPKHLSCEEFRAEFAKVYTRLESLEKLEGIAKVEPWQASALRRLAS